MINRRKYNKERIKDRMYKNAVSYWGVQNVDNLDPIIKLLIEALANQIYDLSNDFNNIEIRLLEKIAHLLTPDILNASRPAHMILKAKPIETKSVITKMNGFYYDDPVFNVKNIMNACFYPVDTFSLIRGEVQSVICGRNIYSLGDKMTKELVARSIERTELFERNIWIGLDLDADIKTIKNLSFYFNFLNTQKANEYLHLLSFTNWECNGMPVTIKDRIYTVTEDEKDRNSLMAKYDLSGISDESILNFYHYHFITIHDEIRISTLQKERIPAEVQDLFRGDVDEFMKKPLIWIKITFPPNFNEDILDNIVVAINAFPVVNKRLKEKQAKTNGLTSVVSLNTAADEYFLSIHSLTDSRDHHYEQLPFQEAGRTKAGTYSIKRGGIERFDSRDAKEYISNLIDLLREEGAAFSLIGKGFLSELIQQIDSTTTIIDQKLKEINENREVPSYLIIDSEEKGETLYVNYWVTNCDLANDIKAGAFFKAYNETFVESDSVFSLTTSIGGRKVPKSNNVLDRYKYILTSRDRIYTHADVVNFCYSEFGDIISDVEVKKGVQVSPRPKEGLVRTIDIFIRLKQNYEHLITDKGLVGRMVNLLIEKSPDSFNYRVFIQQKKS